MRAAFVAPLASATLRALGPMRNSVAVPAGRRLVCVGHSGIGQRTLGDIAGGDEFRFAHRIELQGAVAGSAITVDGVGLRGFGERRVSGSGQHVKGREESDRRKQDAEQHDRFAADLVGKPAEEHIKRRADSRRL